MPDPYRKISLSETSAYEHLYRMVARNFFSGSLRADQVLLQDEKTRGAGKYILLTWEFDEDFVRRISESISHGADITLVYVGDSRQAALLAAAESRMAFYQVTVDNDIFEALKGSSAGRAGGERR